MSERDILSDRDNLSDTELFCLIESILHDRDILSDRVIQPLTLLLPRLQILSELVSKTGGELHDLLTLTFQLRSDCVNDNVASIVLGTFQFTVQEQVCLTAASSSGLRNTRRCT